MKLRLRPLDDRIVIKQSEAEEKTTGGIILPDSAKEKPQIGKVIAIGPGKLLDDGKRAKMSVKKNDKVIYAKYIGSEIEIDNEQYVILRESDVLGIVEK
ncbi:MAG: co-chaperone GroES [Planctomycetes bacterium]|nr:co-chaperone GroES [Planctomycetota bacterium]